MAESATSHLNHPIIENYDIIGFDPRGVGDSALVDCMPDDELGLVLDASYRDTGRRLCGVARRHEIVRVSTNDAARDMDVMRAALGENKLDYFGFSYGTHLGGQYAELFPDNVGRMVLDGAVDPAIPSLDSSYFQAVGFEKALTAYVEYCLEDGDCPLEGDTADEAKEFLQEQIEDSLENPLPTMIDDRSVTPGIYYTGIATTLYAEEPWPYLTEALSMAIERGDGSLLLSFNDLMIGRDTMSGEFMDNSLEARWAINCIDYPAGVDEEAVAENDARLHEDAPTFAPYFEGGDVFCNEWPHTADEVPGLFLAEGSSEIIVIGTVGDPATPYEAAVSLAEQLDNGILLTWERGGARRIRHGWLLYP